MLKDNGSELTQTRTTTDTENWRALARKAAEENDPDKLLWLVHDLCRILEEHDNSGTQLNTNS